MNSWHKYLVEQSDRCDRLWGLLSNYIGPDYLRVTLSMESDCIKVYYLDQKNLRTILWFTYKGVENNSLTVYHSSDHTIRCPLCENELIRLVKEALQKYDVED